ncbi:hypothetical protein HYDPIDRAFT_25348 [Hydnomerulius pinastri MD-312]|nr:hypothetical protein HYDPIDRAFT_25348 [Hydnomerulius pinastri MD-312]
MDPDLTSSKSVPSNLDSRSHNDSIPGSGSYQSYLSSTGSLHRVRTTSGQALQSPTGGGEKPNLHALESGLAGRYRSGSLSFTKQLLGDPVSFIIDDLRRIRSWRFWRLRTLVTLYCCLSVAFFSIRVHAHFREVFSEPSILQAGSPSVEPVSPLTNISIPQRLSIAFPNLPPPVHLDAFVVQDHYFQSRPTACLWTEDFQIDAALASVHVWPGPVSLVVVTSADPNSTEYKNLLGNITMKHPGTNLSLHILYVRSINGGSSNSYLNMARFFAQTAQVILFPAGLPNPDVRSHASWLDKLHIGSSFPVILSNATHKAFLPIPLAPVVLPKNHQVWCTERFFLFGSRALDWEDCLWQLWLESAGEVSSIAVPQILNGSMNATTDLVSPYTMKVRLRWSSKYRTEACAFVLKRSQALDPLTKLEKRRMQWRKKFCRETLGPVATD